MSEIPNQTIFDDRKVNGTDIEGLLWQIRSELCTTESESVETIIENINIAYQKALVYLEEQLFYEPQEIWKAWKFQFTSLEDIANFLQATQSERGKIYCRIVKVTIAMYNTDPSFNDAMAEVINKTNSVIENKLVEWIQIREREGNSFSGILTLENSPWSYKTIPFRFISRIKSQESMVSKEIRDPKYFLLDNLSDIYGWKFYIQKREDILEFSQYIAGMVFKQWVYDIKDRGMFTDEEIDGNMNLHDDFRKKCNKRNLDRKKISSDAMRDWRIVSPYKKDDAIKNLSLEIGFVLDNGENERGLDGQHIYAFIRKIDEIIRLDQYIFLSHIEKLAHMCFIWIKNQEDKITIFRELRDRYGFIWKNVKYQNNSHTQANLWNIVIPALVEYFLQKSGVEKIRVKGWRKNRFAYSNQRQISLHQDMMALQLDHSI